MPVVFRHSGLRYYFFSNASRDAIALNALFADTLGRLIHRS
jgi:hypothetical protein